MPKRTYQPHKEKAKKKHGFLKKQSSKVGKRTIKNRRRKGRKKLTTH